MSSNENEDGKYDVRWDHNPLGPFPRKEELMPPTKLTHDRESTHRSTSQPRAGGNDANYPGEFNMLGDMEAGGRHMKLPSQMHTGEAGLSRNNNVNETYSEEFNMIGAIHGEVDKMPIRGHYDSADGINTGEMESQDTNDVLDQLFAQARNLDRSFDEPLNLGPDATLNNNGVLGDQSGNNSNAEVEDQGSEKVDADGQRKRKGSSRINMLARGGACEFCKKRKLKCSAEQPSCAVCLKAGRECVYSQKKQRSRVRTLEDRLAELENRLDKQTSSQASNNGTTAAMSGQSSNSAPYDTSGPSSVSSMLGMPSVESGGSASGSDQNPFSYDLSRMPFSMDTSANFDLSLIGIDPSQLTFEPDLMTLADAAAADAKAPPSSGTWPWDGMTEVEIATEIVKAVEGGKGLGEKIVGHLMQLYLTATDIPYLHLAFRPSSLLDRLASSSPPHPALILSLIPLLLPLSPSSTLSESAKAARICARIETPSKLHAAHAVSVADSRITDLMTAGVMRTYHCFDTGRLLEGWTEGAASASMAIAAGFSKMGGMADQILVKSNRMPNDPDAVKKDEELRSLRYRSTLIAPPVTVSDLAERIRLFWTAYICQVAPAAGWNWSSMMNEDEITTPFPRDNYMKQEDMRDQRTIRHFINGEANTGREDSSQCQVVKAWCIVNRTCRLYDTHPSVSTPEKRESLLKVAQDYLSSLPTLLETAKGGDIPLLSETLHGLNLALILLYLKRDIDATQNGILGSENEQNVLHAARDFMDVVNFASQTGLYDLVRSSLGAVSLWGITGRTLFKLASRYETSQSPNLMLASEYRGMGNKLIESAKIVAKKMRYAALEAQVLENASLGSEAKQGVWERTNFAP